MVSSFVTPQHRAMHICAVQRCGLPLVTPPTRTCGRCGAQKPLSHQVRHLLLTRRRVHQTQPLVWVNERSVRTRRNTNAAR